MTIDRDAFRREGFAKGATEEAEALSESVDEFAARAPDDHDAIQLTSLAEQARTVAFRTWVFDPDSHWVKDSLQICMQATTAAYAIWYADESVVELPLGPRAIRFETGQEPRRGAPARWIRTACIAALLRDKKITRRLLTLDPVPSEGIGVRMPMWNIEEQVVLRCFLEGKASDRVLGRINEMRALTTPKKLEPWSAPAANDFGLPRMAILEAIIREDQEGFTTALTSAVKRFQDHYKAEPLTLESVLSIELCGLSALAVETGLLVDVEADELLMRLIDDSYLAKP